MGWRPEGEEEEDRGRALVWTLAAATEELYGNDKALGAAVDGAAVAREQLREVGRDLKGLVLALGEYLEDVDVMLMETRGHVSDVHRELVETRARVWQLKQAKLVGDATDLAQAFGAEAGLAYLRKAVGYTPPAVTGPDSVRPPLIILGLETEPN